jgi:PAS domain S-box-containing protein
MPDTSFSVLDPEERTLLERSPIGIVEIGLDRRIHYANAEALRIIGSSDYRGRAFDESIVYEGSEAAVAAQLARRREGLISSYEIDIVRQSDGRKIPVSITGVPLRDSHGQIIASLGVLRSLEVEAAIDEIERLNSDTAHSQGLVLKVAAQLCRTFPADAVIVSRYSDSHGHANPFYFYRHGSERRAIERSKRWIPLNAEQQVAVHEAKTRVIDDLPAFMRTGIWQDKRSDSFVQTLLDEGYASTLSRPVRRRGRVIGTMTLLRKTAGGFQPEQMRLIDLLPVDTSVVQAIDAIDREQEARRFKLLQELSRCTTVDAAARVLATRLVEIFRWSHVSIFRVDYVNEQIRLVAQHWLKEAQARLPEGYTQSISAGVLGRVVKRAAHEVVSDVTQDGDYCASVQLQAVRPVRSELSWPIIWGDRRTVRWIINVEETTENAFSENETQWLGEVANEVGGMLESIGTLQFHTECFRNTAEATIVTDAELNIKKANPAAARLLGYDDCRQIDGSLKDLLADSLDYERIRNSRDRDLGEFRLRLNAQRPNLATLLAGIEIEARALDRDERVPGSDSSIQAASDALSTVTAVISRTQLPDELGGSIFVLKDSGAMRDTVQREMLNQATYEIAAQTRTPLSLAMAALERLGRSSEFREPIAKIVRQLGRVKHGYVKLALGNPGVALCASNARVDLRAELEAGLYGLPDDLRSLVHVTEGLPVVLVHGDHFQIGLLIETLLSLLLRSAPEREAIDVVLRADSGFAELIFSAFMPMHADDETASKQRSEFKGELALCEPLITRLAESNSAQFTQRVLDENHIALALRFITAGTGSG